MPEICFSYSAPSVAEGVVDDLARLHPVASRAHTAEDGSVVHVPDILWRLELVPEIALGLGGRLTACRPSPRHPGCAYADHEPRNEPAGEGQG